MPWFYFLDGRKSRKKVKWIIFGLYSSFKTAMILVATAIFQSGHRFDFEVYRCARYFLFSPPNPFLTFFFFLTLTCVPKSSSLWTLSTSSLLSAFWFNPASRMHWQDWWEGGELRYLSFASAHSLPGSSRLKVFLCWGLLFLLAVSSTPTAVCTRFW